MPPWIHEFVAAPLAVALAFTHLARALGARRAIGEMGALVAYGYVLEWVAMAVFRSHVYGTSWVAAPRGVPLAVAGVWAAVIVSAMTLAARRPAPPALTAVRAALTAVALDLLIEPAATRLSLWAWTPPGAWLGVPLGNFVGWMVIVGTWTWGAQRFAGHGARGRAALERAVLAAGCVATLVAVGLVWRALGVEERLPAAAGWGAAGVMALATSAIAALRRAPSAKGYGSGLPQRLAAVRGPLPALVIGLLWACFATDALVLGEPALLAVAGASLCALAGALRSGRASSG